MHKTLKFLKSPKQFIHEENRLFIAFPAALYTIKCVCSLLDCQWNYFVYVACGSKLFYWCYLLVNVCSVTMPV